MRVFILLLALVATPFVAGVSQDQTNNRGGHAFGRPSDPKTVHCERRSATATERLQLVGKDDCVPLAPPPPPPPVVVPAGAVIGGLVYNDVNGKPGLSGWVVELSGVDTLGATVSASMRSDASGHYAFTGLLPGTYTICEVVETGWSQTFPWIGPSCASGFGQSVPLQATESSPDFNNFGNVTQK